MASKSGKAVGFDAIKNEFLKHVVSKQGAQGFIHTLRNLCNLLVNKPEMITSIPNLYLFKVTLIPKANGGWRPICV